MKTALRICLLLSAAGVLQACQNREVRLFDGKSLEGWVCGPAEVSHHWRVEDGILVGENADQLASILWTTGQYGDFELELDYMSPSGDYDSGVFLRGESHQVQIGISRSLQKDMTGCIYAPIDEQGSYPAQTDKIEQFHRKGDWNHLKIIMMGNRIQTFLNGEPFVDYEAIRIPERGPIGLQLHGGVHMVIKFKDILIREYPMEDSL
jgi:hypothetical protein